MDTIRWKFRLIEDETAFADQFTTFNDRVHFFGRNAPRPTGGTDASMSWGVFATGAAHSSGVGEGQTFWIYDNATGTSAFNLDNAVDSGIALIPNQLYSFELNTDSANLSYTVSIVDEDSGASFSSAAPHGFRDLSATASSHTVIHFGVGVSPAEDVRAFDLDSVSVETGDPGILPPSISTHPADQAVIEGTAANFSVETTGTEPFSYQWNFDGNPLDGETGSSLIISAVTLDDAGAYSVTVSNDAGTVTSDLAMLTIIPSDLPDRTIISDFNDGIYPGERGQGWEGPWEQTHGEADPSVVDADPFDEGSPYLHVDMSGGARNVARQYESGNGMDVIRWKFRLVEDPADFAANFNDFGDRVHFFGRDALRLIAGTDASMSWAIFAVGNAHSSGVGAGQTFWVYDNVAGDSAFNLENNLDTGIPLVLGDIYAFEVEVDSISLTYTVMISDETSGASFTSAAPHTFRDLSATPTSHTILHVGLLSVGADVRAYDLDSVEIFTSEPPPSPPSLLTQPTDLTVLAGTDVTLSVVADGSEPFSYQWQKDGNDIPNASADELMLTSVTSGDAGVYSVLVSNSEGQVISDPAELTVQEEIPILDAISALFDNGAPDFPSESGMGWLEGWSQSSGTGGATVSSDSPLDEETSYLHVDVSETSGGYRNVLRPYTSAPGVDVTLPHVIRWKFRYNEDPSDFDANFNTFNDRVHFFARSKLRPDGGTDASMSWGIIAVGDAHSSGVGAGKTFWIFDNQAGDSAFNLDNHVDTGLPLVPGDDYAFSVIVDPRKNRYWVDIVDETTNASFNSESGHIYRDLSATVDSHNILHFGLRASPDSDFRTFDLDSLTIAPLTGPEIVSNFDDGIFPGEAGDGWVDAWAQTGTGPVLVDFASPLDSGTGYLHVDLSGQSGEYRNVLRQYESTDDLSITQPHTIRWKFRWVGSEEDFANNFTTFNDRVHFFARSAPRANGGTDASMSWAIFVHGDGNGDGAASGKKFYVYDNLTGDSTFGVGTLVDTGVPLVPNDLYSFEVTFNPFTQSYTAFILNHDTGETFRSAAPHLVRDLSTTADSHTILHFGLRASPNSEPGAFDLDSVSITPALGIEFPPTIVNLIPGDGASFHDATQGLQFQVISSSPISNDAIQVLVNGVDVSSELSISGEPNALWVSYPGLDPNSFYSVEISASNDLGMAQVTAGFDTFNEAGSVVIEAEDYNYQAGMFQDDPVPSGFTAGGAQINGNGIGYLDLVGVADIDYASSTVPAGDPSQSYRFEDFIGFQYSADSLRQKYSDSGAPDYHATELSAGDWMNYTRTFAAGNYNAYLRVRATSAQDVVVERVLSDPSQGGQQTEGVGSFGVLDSGGNYVFVPLMSNSGELASLALEGIQTLRLAPTQSNFNLDLNYWVFLAIPEIMESIVISDARISGTEIHFSFPTQSGRIYQVQTSGQLPAVNWTVLQTITGDGSIMEISDPLSNGQGYYQVVLE